MKNMLLYFKKPHRIAVLINYIFSGLGTLCIIMYSDLPDWTKAVAFIMYCLLILFTLASMLRRSVINNYLEMVEQLFVKEGLSIQQDNIESYLEICKRIYSERGIADIEERSNYTEMIRHISGARNSIRIIAYYGNRFLHETRDDLIKAIKRDVAIQIIIAERESELLKEVWELEGREKKDKWDNTNDIIKEIEAQTKDRPELFAYQKCNTQIRYALILVDNKWAWWTPYHPGIDVVGTASFILMNKGEKSIIHQCKDHFGKLWFYLDKKQRNTSNDVIG